MSTEKDRHVVPNPDGGWDVKAPNAKKASAHRDTQAEAERRSKEITDRTGGDTVIHDKKGRIRDKDTGKAGHDPSPPKDRRH